MGKERRAAVRTSKAPSPRLSCSQGIIAALWSHLNNPTVRAYESSTIQASADMAAGADLIVVVTSSTAG